MGMARMDVTDAVDDKRDEVNRRRFTWRTVLFGFLRSRRRDIRRGDEDDVVFLDWHHPWLFFLAVGTMLLSCVDAIMTLKLLDAGMIEANPFMAVLLGHGTAAFTASKMILTGTSILILVFLAKARFLNRFRTELLLTISFSFYCCLVCYEFIYLLKVL